MIYVNSEGTVLGAGSVEKSLLYHNIIKFFVQRSWVKYCKGFLHMLMHLSGQLHNRNNRR